MKRKKQTRALAILGMAILAFAPFLPAITNSQANVAYTAALAVSKDQPDEDDDDFNGIRFKLFFPNRSATAQ